MVLLFKISRISSFAYNKMEDGIMYTDYVIQEGDTLESIAINQNIPMFQLLALNGLEDAITLVPGNTLKIPNQFYSFIKYKVQKGDTLTSIAKEYETTVEILR